MVINEAIARHPNMIRADIARARQALAFVGVRDTKGMRLAEFGAELRVLDHCRSLNRDWSYPNMFSRRSKARVMFEKVLAAKHAADNII